MQMGRRRGVWFECPSASSPTEPQRRVGILRGKPAALLFAMIVTIILDLPQYFDLLCFGSLQFQLPPPIFFYHSLSAYLIL